MWFSDGPHKLKLMIELDDHGVFSNLNYSMLLCSGLIQQLIRCPSKQLARESHTSGFNSSEVPSKVFFVVVVCLLPSFLFVFKFKKWLEKACPKRRSKSCNHQSAIFCILLCGVEGKVHIDNCYVILWRERNSFNCISEG